MLKLRFFICLSCVYLFSSSPTLVNAFERSWEVPSIYESISNLRKPDSNDWKLIQRYLLSDRKNLDLLQDYEDRAREFRIIDPDNSEAVSKGLECFNCDENYRGACVIVYVSLNKSFRRGIERLIKNVAQSEFVGHLLWQIGGWPDVEGGSLNLAHVPYSFKACMFREVMNMGYEKVLWLDSSIVPLGGVQRMFEVIEQKGYLAVSNGWRANEFSTPYLNKYYNLEPKDVRSIKTLRSGVFGVDLCTAKGREIIEDWYQAAKDQVPFYSPKPDQTVLSIIVHKHGCELEPYVRLVSDMKQVTEDTLALLDRSYVYCP